MPGRRSGLPPHLFSNAFYAACFHALVPSGLFVVNLPNDARHESATHLIGRGIGGNVLRRLDVARSSRIVVAGREIAVMLQALQALGWAGTLDAQVKQQLRAECAHIEWCDEDTLGGRPASLTQVMTPAPR